MQYLYVLCGSPGSGKTTLSKKISEEQNFVRYSFDEMRCFKHSELTPHVVNALQEGESVVVDALFTRSVWRKMILGATNNIECKRILIYMSTPLDECIRRNAGRPHPLPEFMVKDVYQSIEPPSIDEGWDEIIYYGGDNHESNS